MTADIVPHLERLAAADAVWYASVRPDGRPHLAPIWHVWEEEAAWVCTGPSTVRAKNLATSNAVSLSLADTSSPVIMEGTARIVESIPEAVRNAFATKYDWNIIGYEDYCVIRIEPTRMLVWMVDADNMKRFHWRDGQWQAG